MQFRVGLADICAAVVVLVVLLLPAPEPTVIGAYTRLHSDDDRLGTTGDIDQLGRLQARLAANPGDGAAADELSQLLIKLLEYDHALRVAGDATTRESPSRWQAYLAVSYTHADRQEIPPALEYARKAVAECEGAQTTCDNEARIRLSLYTQELERGVRELSGGADPKEAPDEFRDALMKTHPTATFRGGGSR